jgi:hypothetical protein
MTGRFGAAGCLALVLAAAAWPAAAAVDPAACPPTAQPAIAAPGLAAAAASGREVRIIAFGSSSTAGAGASLPRFAYPPRLEAALRRALPGVSVTVVNRGASGEDVGQMLARIETEVLARAPDLVVWQVGANAALRRMDPGRFRQFLLTGLARLRAAGGGGGVGGKHPPPPPPPPSPGFVPMTASWRRSQPAFPASCSSPAGL